MKQADRLEGASSSPETLEPLTVSNGDSNRGLIEILLESLYDADSSVKNLHDLNLHECRQLPPALIKLIL